jgi:peptidoglycan/LPS O-acetylase OafA/YrhL
VAGVSTKPDDQTLVASPPATPTERRLDIQGLRGIAVLVVVAFHAHLPLPGGYVGVDMFFVISGFVITSLLTREVQRSGRLNFGNFYSRRVRRLLPALALMIVVVALACVFLASPLGAQMRAARAAAAASTFSANWFFYSAKTGYFDASLNTNPFLHTWSLAVEEQFYLFFPAFILFALNYRRRHDLKMSSRKVAAVLVGCVLVASFIVSLATSRGTGLGLTHNPVQFAFYASITRAWEFAVGAIVALIGAYARPTKAWITTIGVTGAALVVLSVRLITPTTPFPGTAALAPVLATAALIFIGMHAQSGVSRLLSVRPLVQLGDVSYGWYLWHWPLIVFAIALWGSNTALLTFVAVLSLIPTYLSYRFLESPIRFDRSIVGRRALWLGVACVIVPLTFALGLGISTHVTSRFSAVKQLEREDKRHADTVRHCDSTARLNRRPKACTWTVASATGSVWLVGDSNAGQFTEPVAKAANDNGFDLHVATSSDCPFADLVMIRFGTPYTACRVHFTRAVASLASLHPSLVIVASDASDYINNAKYGFRDPHSGAAMHTPATKAEEWEVAVASMLRTLDKAHVRTVLINTAPHFTGWELASCAAIRVYSDVSSCGTSKSRAEIDKQRAAGLEAEHRAASGVSTVTEVDFTDQLCPTNRCSTNNGSFFMYRDGAHLSVPGARTLTERFRELIGSTATTAAKRARS